MNTVDIARFEKKLLAEKVELEKQLASIGKSDASSPGGWDATSGGLEVDPADDNEMADKFEELEGNNAIVTKLEAQLAEVIAALDRAKAGTYGICEKSGKPIETGRLEANPSARTCLEYANK